MVDILARGLQQAGHEPVVVTTGDATCEVPRRWTFPHPPQPMGHAVSELHHVQQAYQMLADCDVVHDHTVVGPVWAAARRVRPPVVVTCHGPFDPHVRPVLRDVGEWASLVAISHHQASTAPEVPIAAVIHHGVEAQRFPVGLGDGAFLLFLGRFAPEKGAHEAIEIARGAGVPLRIAAKMREPRERQYFERWVEPRLGPDVQYLGEVSVRERDDLLGRARALVNPIAWDEPFGLVMVEALACGTPVVTFAAGAAPEIVEHGRTGFVCDDVTDAVLSVRELDSIDRHACRQAVQTRFSAARMVADHIRLYRSVVARAHVA
jgi:glycosyltransferase involved in cell wall biosynthesis